MNLLLFSIELERNCPPVGGRPRRSGARRWSAVVIAVAVLAGALATGLVGWVAAGGDGSPVRSLRDWLPISTVLASAPPGPTWSIEITTDPPGATVFVDGRTQGQTPASLLVLDGPHTLRLTHRDAVDYQRQLSANGNIRLHISMLRRRPVATQLKPPYPGASINDVQFLNDGRLALAVSEAAQARNERISPLNAAWLFDPATGSIRPFEDGPDPKSPILAVSPDGTRLAFASLPASGRQATSGERLLTEVLVASAGGSSAVTAFALSSVPAPSAPPEVEEIRDLAWTPDGNRLLVTIGLHSVNGSVPGAPRSRVLLVDADATDQDHTPPLELLTLPAEVVPQSYNWAPDAHWVAFLTQAPTGSGSTSSLALCALDPTAGGAVSGFRYVADLGRQSVPAGALLVAPTAWSPDMDGRLVYVAPTPKLTVSNPLGLPTTSGGDPAPFIAAPSAMGLTAEEGRRLGSVTGLMAPEWPGIDEAGDLGILTLARAGQGSKPLTLRAIDPTSGAVGNVDVVLPPAVGGTTAVSARWDLRHGRLLIVSPHDNSGAVDFWLVQLSGGGEVSR